MVREVHISKSRISADSSSLIWEDDSQTFDSEPAYNFFYESYRQPPIRHSTPHFMFRSLNVLITISNS